MAELRERGAESVIHDGDQFIVTGLTVQSHRLPSLKLTSLNVQYKAGATGCLSYEGTAKVLYSGKYLVLWLPPVLLAAAYAALTSPLVILALPFSALAVRALLPITARMWFEEFFHAVERKAIVLNQRPGA